MVIVKVNAGLGNQMFHYAFGRALALRNRTTLKIDATSLQASPSRHYALHHFVLNAEFATPEELSRFKGAYKIGRHPWIDRISQRRRMGSAVRLPERYFHFNPRALHIPSGRDVYAYGAWQSERYFEDQADTIRREFEFRNPPQGLNATLARDIADANSVSMHVRRGDYATDARVNRIHGLVPLDFYRRAAEHIATRVSRPCFYLFSDDPEWTQANLRLSFPVRYVTHNDPDAAIEDIRLMSLCRHHVIANSSFSWWGAWLGRNPDKIVIAPVRWFRHRRHSARDILPSGWIRL
jgi:hypothetical protein